ncbi:hypothetical protein [Enterococcus dispar]|uniref:hypothetical protein n=1 Tax=Enterococcus dispar TaxID=44009 RepID=UPI00288E8B09|nr:hypothetical protein [Enterococcus dispar]MDT2705773.1 hypothetical protein [Enterococcus dispar]
MFKKGQKVKVHGKFVVKTIGDEFVELDPYLQGGLPSAEKFEKQGFTEVTESGAVKHFDGFAIGDFFALDGTFNVIRSNDVYCKLMVGEQMVSVPISKVLEVE